MEDPAYSVVNRLAGGERLVTTLVGDNPESGSREADAEAVERPEAEFGEAVEGGVREVEVFGSDERVEGVEGVDEGGDDDDVLDNVQTGANG